MNARPSTQPGFHTTCLNLLVAVLLLAMALPAPAAVSAEAPSPFLGAWRATDPVDGSDIRLAIAGRPAGPFQITWTESHLGICDREAGIVRGTGLLGATDLNTLHGSLLALCFRTGATVEFDFTWKYHANTDTLSSSNGEGVMMIWTRPGGAGPEPPPLALRVNYGNDWVESFYEPNHAVWVTVTESDGITVKATAQVLTGAREEWGGEAGFQTKSADWVPARPNIEAYDWVFAWVDNGATSRVQIGEIQGKVDVHADSVSGAILVPWLDSNTAIPVECLPWGAPDPIQSIELSLRPDGVQRYTCAWDGLWDIRPGEPVGVAYTGPDGEWVANVLKLPTFVAYKPGAVEGYDWPMGSTITLNVNDGEYIAKAVSEQEPTGVEGRTRVLFEVWRDGQSIENGDHITMTDGNYIKETVVTDLAVTLVNIYTRAVSGIFDPAYSLYAWLYGSDYRVPNKLGDTWWIAFDSLPPGAWGGATQYEIGGDGDGTSIDWQVPMSIFVNSTADAIGNDGSCTLRESVIAANTNTPSGDLDGECPAGLDSETDHIMLAPGATYSLTVNSTGEDNALDGDLDILDNSAAKDLVIEESGGYYATISQDAVGDDRVIQNHGANVELQGLTLRGGSSVDIGGGLLNSGTMTIVNGQIYANKADWAGGGVFNDSAGILALYGGGVYGNTASNDSGGGVTNEGDLTIRNAVVDNNSAGQDGGGIHNSGTVSIDNARLSRNSARQTGGGILNLGPGVIDMTRSTVSGNTSLQSGGGIRNARGATMTVADSVVSGNSALSAAGGILSGGALTVTDSAILNNTALADGDAVYANSDAANTINITGSCVAGNGTIAVFNGYTALQNFTGDWWGHASGPSGSGPGSGDSVGPSIDFSGWLTAAPTICAP